MHLLLQAACDTNACRHSSMAPSRLSSWLCRMLHQLQQMQTTERWPPPLSLCMGSLSKHGCMQGPHQSCSRWLQTLLNPGHSTTSFSTTTIFRSAHCCFERAPDLVRLLPEEHTGPSSDCCSRRGPLPCLHQVICCCWLPGPKGPQDQT